MTRCNHFSAIASRVERMCTKPKAPLKCPKYQQHWQISSVTGNVLTLCEVSQKTGTFFSVFPHIKNGSSINIGKTLWICFSLKTDKLRLPLDILSDIWVQLYANQLGNVCFQTVSRDSYKKKKFQTKRKPEQNKQTTKTPQTNQTKTSQNSANMTISMKIIWLKCLKSGFLISVCSSFLSILSSIILVQCALPLTTSSACSNDFTDYHKK